MTARKNGKSNIHTYSPCVLTVVTLSSDSREYNAYYSYVNQMNTFIFFIYSFDQLQSLGKRVSSSERSGEEVRERIRRLSQERVAVRESWERRNKVLKQCFELQLFVRDSDQIDAATGAQEAFLSNDDLGVRQRLVTELHSCIITSEFSLWLCLLQCTLRPTVIDRLH